MVEGKLTGAKYRDLSNVNLVQSALVLRLGRMFTSQQRNGSKTREELKDKQAD